MITSQYRLVECQTQSEAEYTGAIFRPAQGRLFAQLVQAVYWSGLFIGSGLYWHSRGLTQTQLENQRFGLATEGEIHIQFDPCIHLRQASINHARFGFNRTGFFR